VSQQAFPAAIDRKATDEAKTGYLLPAILAGGLLASGLIEHRSSH
jgi:hypothetical protein